MNSNDFKPGDILLATHREIKKGYHPIVFISGNSVYDFVGGMITHEALADRNVKMKEAHFEANLEVTYDNSYLVKGRFIKSEKWGPFEKKGQLTPEGLAFTLEIISEFPLETFAKYFARQAYENKI